MAFFGKWFDNGDALDKGKAGVSIVTRPPSLGSRFVILEEEILESFELAVVPVDYAMLEVCSSPLSQPPIARTSLKKGPRSTLQSKGP